VIDFTDQVAIVTGAGRGLGRLYALELARRGASVIVNDLGGTMHGDGSDASIADQVVAEIEGVGGVAVASHVRKAARRSSSWPCIASAGSTPWSVMREFSTAFRSTS